MVMRRGSFTISRARITRKINSHIGAIILLQEVGDGGEEQMEPRSKKSEAAAEAAMLSASCHHFSTPRIKHDSGVPEGGNTHTSLEPFISLYRITSRWLFTLLQTRFIPISLYNTVVSIRHLPHLPLLCSPTKTHCSAEKITKQYSNIQNSNVLHHAVIHILQVVGWFPQEK